MVKNLKYLLLSIPLFAIASWELDFDDDFASASNKGTPDVLNGLVMWFPMDEDKSGTTYRDRSCLGNNGTQANSSLQPLFTNFNEKACYKFSGDNFIVSDSESIRVQNGITISTFIICLNQLAYTKVLGKDNGSSGYSFSDPFLGSTTQFSYWHSSVVNRMDYSSATFKSNIWVHVAYTYDLQTQKVYINGQLAIQRADTSAISTNSLNFNVGGGSPYNYFDGYLRHVRVYNRGLTADEVSTIYNKYK